MSLFNVSLKKKEELSRRMHRLGISEKDFKETFIRASGSGGQKVNKTSSCVLLCHGPTGLSVKCQKGRSQALNRFIARRRILDKIERRQNGFVLKEQQRIEKIRRQKRKRSKRAKEKMLDLKHKRSEQKKLRSAVEVSSEGNGG